ncbi:DUF5134 domain-containing protein [Streptomyces phyllanthi]|nr:DUF5134 domain-containing protein [Streptomyces phyllanthi]
MTALSWAVAVVAALVAAVSGVRMATTSGVTRFAAGGDLLMGLCMAAMSLPATVGWYAGHGMVWAVAFGVLGLGGVAMAVRHTCVSGWRQGRHWVHLVVGSLGMVIMTLAMTSTPSGPVLALGGGHSMPGMAGMPGTGHAAGATDTHTHQDTQGMAHAAADAGASSGSASLWRFVVAALAVYFVLSAGASVWARMRGRGTGRSGHGTGSGSGTGLGRWLLAMPDTVLVFLASLTISAWDRTRTAQRPGRGRRRKLGAAPDAALAAHIGMGGTMSAMLLMMAA